MYPHPPLVHCSSFLRLCVAVVPPLEEASESWVCVRGRFSSSFLHLPVRLAPFFVRSLFVLCSSFVRLLFVLCSSFVRLYVALFPPLEQVRGRFSSSFPHLSVRFAPSFVRLFSICPCGSHRLLFVLSPSARAARTVLCSFFVRSLFVFCSSFHYLPVVLRLPVWLAPSFL